LADGQQVDGPWSALDDQPTLPVGDRDGRLRSGVEVWPIGLRSASMPR